MILAEKIAQLRKMSGMSQDELAEKLQVSRQSISKWESAQSVPDLKRILDMAELFGVSTDYLLKDELEQAEFSESDRADSPLRTVSMEEASSFLQLREQNAVRIALGVMLCILSPIALIFLSGASEAERLSLAETQAVGLGLAFLFVLVGCAVALFVSCGLRASQYEYLEREPIDTLYGVDGMVRERREKFRPAFTRQLTIGIVLCVVAVLPLFLSLFLFGEDSFFHIFAVCLLLAIISVGVLLIVRSAVVWDGFQILLEEGDYSRAGKEASHNAAPFNSIYWGLVTAGFLAWGFLGNAWDRCWMVWPVAAVAYGAIYGIVVALRRK
jgi:transcriptional regulator with XRE-family HTH domain